MCLCEREGNISLHVRVHNLAVHPAVVQLRNSETHIKYLGVGGARYICLTEKQSSKAPLLFRRGLLQLSDIHPSISASGTITRDHSRPHDSAGPYAPGRLAAPLFATSKVPLEYLF